MTRPPPPRDGSTNLTPLELSRQSALAGAQQAISDQQILDSHEPRNVLVIELYQVVVRIGWIFKTESIIMPAFLDAIAGAGWLRGLLPVINRVGQSVPPVLYAVRLGAMPRKKWSLLSTTLCMAIVFLALAMIWVAADGPRLAWMPAIFLALYALFSIAHGLNQLALGTLQGKLIRAAHRGRAMVVSTTVGVVLAIVFAWWLLGRWLNLPDGGFGYIFGFTAVCFVIAALSVPALAEPADSYDTARLRPFGHFAASWRTLREDRNFRRLSLVAVLFGTVLILFPHYQALGRQRLALPLDDLMVWVITQNAGTGLFSLLAGPLADRRGNRVVLQFMVVAAASTPLLAVALLHLEPQTAQAWFWIVFAPLGLTPVTLKTLVNYTLEICERPQHPRYLSTLSLCLAAPFLTSPLVGWMIDLTSFEVVFLVGAVLIFAGGMVSLGLDEPRNRRNLRSLATIAPSDGEVLESGGDLRIG